MLPIQAIFDLSTLRAQQLLRQPYQPTTQAIKRQAAVNLPGYVNNASHGTLTGYYKHRCRCLDCRAANAAHASRLRADQRHKRQHEQYQRQLLFDERRAS